MPSLLDPGHDVKVIHLLRKPLSEGTVAANVLAHGTGALNIDASRIATADSLDGGASTTTRASQKGNEGWTRPWMEDEWAREAHAARVRQNVAKAEALGRWPSNLILEHDEGCRCVGTKKVKGTPPTPSGFDRYNAANADLGYRPNTYEKGAPPPPPSRLDADGKETVAAWQCIPGCPVASLNAQSGITRSEGETESGRTGASRFYKQVGGSHETD